MWLEHENFVGMLGEFWAAWDLPSRPMIGLSKKLKALKVKLKSWNKEVFRRIDVQVGECLLNIDRLDKLEERGELSEEERILRAITKCKLDKLWKLEEISWRQKSREIWSRLGDRNTKFFHTVANSNRRRNYIDRLTVHGNQIVGQHNLAREAVSFYQSLYTDSSKLRAFPEGLIFGGVPSDSADGLLCKFSEEEIYGVVRSCAGDKAPGPDGFSMEFFKRNWSIVKGDVCTAFQEFFDCASIPHSMNSSFIVLIPKKDAIDDFKDLRPICLVGCFYKMLSKLLMYRFKVWISHVISSPQCAFIPGRQILDASLIANELIDSRLRGGRPGIIFKLDIEKAYDHVNWECLFKVLKSMRFEEKWIGWLRACVTSAHFSVLVNGEASGYFQSSRGLRQGDSLSPYLFIVVMEVLSAILKKMQDSDLVGGFYMNDALRLGLVSHILYADDAMLFCDASIEQVRMLAAALICFESITGLRVNLHKSSMFVIGEVLDASVLASIFGCQIEDFPTTYLGLPLGDLGNKARVWDPVIYNLEKRLEGWKAKFLSLGARVTLLQSVLSNLPVYFMSMFKAPTSVIARVEKMQRRFLWAGTSEKNMIHWINWDVVKTSKQLGGLGVQDMKILNSALLGKWVWRYAVERSAWWRGLIVDKCGEGVSKWQPVWGLRSAGRSVWKWIVLHSSIFWSHGFIDPGGGFVFFLVRLLGPGGEIVVSLSKDCCCCALLG
ncbi:Transposon TX1 uncharacterized 149 kDa protein [Linum grandiflorum]